MQPSPLDWREWDFGRNKLPPEELAACYAHEYGREIAKRCSYVMAQLKILWRANELPQKDQTRGPDLSGASIFHPKRPRKIRRRPERVRGDEAAFKLWTFGIPVETLSVRGSETKSWYVLSDNLRHKSVQLSRNTSRLQREAPYPSVLLRTFSELGSADNPPVMTSLWIEFLRECWLARNIDYGFFAIDPGASLPELKKQIFRWLNEWHTGRKLASTSIASRGQLHDQLRWLGALRYKEHYGPRFLSLQNEPRIAGPAPYKYKPDLYEKAKKAKTILDDRISKIMQPMPWLNGSNTSSR